MASNNMINAGVDPNIEDDVFAQEVEAVKKWWSDSRWRYTKRPFTAEQIVSKRGHLQVEYPSNAQSKKLWKILEGRFQVCKLYYKKAVLNILTNLPRRTVMLVIPMAA